MPDNAALESEDRDESNENFVAENVPISFKEALISVKKLQHFASLIQLKITEKVIDLYNKIHVIWAQSKLKESHQIAITNFFENY